MQNKPYVGRTYHGPGDRVMKRKREAPGYRSPGRRGSIKGE